MINLTPFIRRGASASKLLTLATVALAVGLHYAAPVVRQARMHEDNVRVVASSIPEWVLHPVKPSLTKPVHNHPVPQRKPKVPHA